MIDFKKQIRYVTIVKNSNFNSNFLTRWILSISRREEEDERSFSKDFIWFFIFIFFFTCFQSTERFPPFYVIQFLSSLICTYITFHLPFFFFFPLLCVCLFFYPFTNLQVKKKADRKGKKGGGGNFDDYIIQPLESNEKEKKKETVRYNNGKWPCVCDVS